MSMDRFFYEHSIFRYEEFRDWKISQGEVKSISINTALRYYQKIGRVILIRRKLYAVLPPNQTPENFTVDPYLIAGKAVEDAVLGYHTALELMGLAYSTFGQFTYITQQKSKPFEFQGQWFQSVAVPVALQKAQKIEINTDSINRQGVFLKVTNPERTYVDILNRIELCGGWEEVYRSIQNFTVLDIDKLIQYSLLMNNAQLNATVGYFLSLRKGAFAVSEKSLLSLRQAIPTKPQYFSKKITENFELVKPWNIFLPKSVIHQSWEEPNAEF